MPWGREVGLIWIRCPLGEILVQDIQVCEEVQSELPRLSTLPVLEEQRSPEPRVLISPAHRLARRPCVLLPLQTLFLGVAGAWIPA